MKQKKESTLQIVYQEEESGNRWLDFLWEFCLLFVLQAGVLQFLFTWTQMERRAEIFSMGITGLCAFLQVLLHGLTKGKAYSRAFAPVAAVILLIVRNPRSVYYGLFGVINYIISWWNVKNEDAVSLFMQTKITDRDIVSFVLVFGALLMAVTWRTVRKKDVANTMPIPLLCAIAGVVIDRFSVVGCSFFFIGWVGIWLSKIRTRASLRRTVWLLVISAGLLLVAAGNRSGQMDSVRNLKEKTADWIERVRYGTDTLPQGDLSKADNLLVGEKKRLRVTTGQAKSMYLRGFVGGRYQDGCWQTLPKSTYKGENTGLLNWLSESDFVPQNQYAAYMKWDANPDISENTVRVQNIGANRAYIYAPYSADAILEQGIRKSQDANYMSRALIGKRSYTYTEWSGSRPGELLYADAWVSSPASEGQRQYTEAESVYASFVYANYLDVDPDMAAMLQKLFYEDWSDEPNVYYTTNRIREVLEKKLAYRESPEMAPDGAEPISWALNQGHEGNAVTFASAAVLAYRVQGIPARYVEGYFLSEQQAAQAENGTVTLTTGNSHAWVEVYLDGVGWIPVDVTPGYYYDTYTLLEMVQKPEKVQRTAAEEDSNQDGQAIEDERNQDAGTESPEAEKKDYTAFVEGVVYVLLLCVGILVLLQIVYTVWIASFDRRFHAYSEEKQTKYIIRGIYRLLNIYGYQAKPGWHMQETDERLAAEIDACYTGEYIRISTIIEKYVYGQEALTQAEIRTLYLYAQKLYEAGRQKSVWIRLRRLLQFV